MRLYFKRFKTLDGKLEGHFVDWAPTPLHDALAELLGPRDEQQWDTSGSNVNPGEIVVNLHDENLFQYEQQIKDLVIDHGSQESVDARVAAEQAEEVEINNLKGELETLVENLSYTKVDTHIDNTFNNLTSNQKESLKNLYKVVLYLAKEKCNFET